MKSKIAIAMGALALLCAGLTTSAAASEAAAGVANAAPAKSLRGSDDVYIDRSTGSAFVNTFAGWKRATTTAEPARSLRGSDDIYIDTTTGAVFVNTIAGWKRTDPVDAARL